MFPQHDIHIAIILLKPFEISNLYAMITLSYAFHFLCLPVRALQCEGHNQAYIQCAVTNQATLSIFTSMILDRELFSLASPFARNGAQQTDSPKRLIKE